MPRTQNCNLCQASVYFKTAPTGRKLLWDTESGNWHHRRCPKLSDFRRQEMERLVADFSAQPSKPVPPPAPVQSPPTQNGHTGLSEIEVRRLIAEDRPQLVSAAVAEAQRFSQEMIDALSRESVSKNRHESDYTNLRAVSKEMDAEIRTLNAQVQQLASDLAMQQASTKTIEVKLPDGKTINVGRQHREFERLVAYLGIGVCVFMAGPAGSGKTEGAKAAAKALGLEYRIQPLNPMMTDSKLTGFMGANGQYVTTAMRQAYEEGHLLVLDEGDNANPSILAGMNALIGAENGVYGFPDAQVQQHPNFRVVLTANTWGRGADRKYVARQQLDAATLNRFVNIPWDYDEEFELALVGNVEWTRYVQKVRKAVFDLGLEFVVSPRQSRDGAKLLAIGRDRAEVEEACIWANIPKDAQVKIRSRMGI